MMWSLYARILYDKRWFILGWSAAIGGMVALVVAFFPSFSSGDTYEALFSSIPEQMKGLVGDADSFNKLPNYIATQLYDIRVPIFMMIMALVLAQGLSVALEERGDLRTILTLPLSRGRILLETWLSGVTIVGLVSVVCALATYLGVIIIGEELPHQLIWRLCALSALSGVVAFSLPLAAGFATGKRAATLTIGLIVTVGSFILSSFAPTVEWLESSEVFSLLYYYDTAALLDGEFNIRDLLVLTAVTLVSAVLGWIFFRRRDVKA